MGFWTKFFKVDFSFLIALYTLLVVPDIFGVINGSSSFTFLFTGLFVAYLVALADLFLSRWHRLQVISRGLFLGIASLFFLVDLFCLKLYGLTFNEDYAAAFVNTNDEEMNEFLATYLSASLLLLFVVVAVLFFWLIRKLLKMKIKPNKRVMGCTLVLVAVGGFLFFSHPMNKRSIVYKLSLVMTPRTTPELSRYRSHPALQVDSVVPEKVVMIVGESLTKHHCSLYGYEKKTNPRLEKLRDTADLIVFPHVKSPETNTEKSLRDVFTTYPERYQGKHWYKSITLFEVMTLAGYHSCWVSNQSKKGLWDNVVGKFADLCDVNHFVGNKYAGVKRRNLDGEVLPLLSAARSKDAAGHDFYIVHLMGSHPAFEYRYPASSEHFTPEMYPGKISRQQRIIAQYDNSVLYNDSVVSEIIKMFEDDEAIVFYFSDHALDLFQTSPDFAGHAKGDAKSREYGKDIPFLIYMSPKYIQRYPEKAKLIAAKRNEHLNTGNFIYMLMDIVGIRFKDDLKVETLSPFR